MVFRLQYEDTSPHMPEYSISVTRNEIYDENMIALDDLGTEYSTAFSSAAIYNILNSRIMMGKPTIISTNLSMKDMEKTKHLN